MRIGYSHLNNAYSGECIIIANGPSLADVPLGFLRSRFSFGCNRIHAMLPDFCPSAYAGLGSDQYDTEEKRAYHYDLLADPRLHYFFINRLVEPYFRHGKTYSIMGGRVYGLKDTWRYSNDPLFITGLGGSMIYPVLQIADYLGFDTAYLVGLDGTYNRDKWHFYEEDSLPEFSSGPGPYGTDENWRAKCETVFALADAVWREKGKRIVNVTPNSMVEAFEKGGLPQ